MATIGWVNKNNNTVLWDIPARPPNLDNISYVEFPGNYVFGLNFFHTRDFTLTNIFRRKVAGGAEEFLLGAISVILIALLSEIVQAILMHTRRSRNGSRRGVHIAFLVDELYHFRNVVTHFVGSSSATGIRSEESRAIKKRTYTSLIIVLIALALMAADVFAVYLTQPRTVHSRKDQYNLRGVQPIVTEQGRSRWARRLARDRVCVVPVFTSSNQDRLFFISACVLSDVVTAHDNVDDITDFVTVKSFFHIAGSDHYVTFGDAKISIRNRAFLYISEDALKSGAPARRFFFENEMLPNNAFEKFLHQLFIYSAIEESCNHNDTKYTCKEIVDSLEIVKEDTKPIVEPIKLWHARNGSLLQDTAGYQTKFKVTMNNPFFSVDHGVSPLVTTAKIQEVATPGTYLDLKTDAALNELVGLISEEGRMAGLPLFSTVLLIFAVSLVVLRLTLQPISLGEMAWNSRDMDSMMDSSVNAQNREGMSRSASSTVVSFDDIDGAVISVDGVKGAVHGECSGSFEQDGTPEKKKTKKPT